MIDGKNKIFLKLEPSRPHLPAVEADGSECSYQRWENQINEPNRSYGD